jgi:cytochrome c biogenesis protein
MAQNVQSTPLAPTADRGAGASVDGIFEHAWHLLTSMRVAVILIFVAAGLALLGTVIQQAPTAIASNPEAMTSWINENVRLDYGNLTDPMNALGLFSIFSTIYFRLVVALLCISIIACTLHRITGLWRTAVNPRVDVGPAFFEHAPQRDTIIVHRSTDQALATVQGVMKHKRFRTVQVTDDVVHLYADKNRWGPLGSIFGHVAFVVIIAGAIVGGLTGFRVPSFAVTEGETLPVPNRPDLALRLDAYHEAYDPETNIPVDFASDVVLLQNGREVARQTIRVNQPATVDGVSFFQGGRGNSLILDVKGPDNGTIFAGGAPLGGYSDRDGRAAGLISLGVNAPYVAYAFTTLGGSDPLVKPGQVMVQLYDAATGKKVDQAIIEPNTPATIAGYTFTYQRETKFSSFSVSKDPGAWLVWLGCTLLVGGFALVFMFPHRRVWGRIVARQGGGAQIELASVGRRESQVGKEFTNLVNDIRAAFHAPVKG